MEEEKMECIEKSEHLELQLADSNVVAAQSALELAHLRRQFAMDNLRKKYQLGDLDRYDPQTFKILRAPSPEVKESK